MAYLATMEVITMKKKFGILCLIAVMLVTAVSCSGGKAKDNELDKAKKSAEAFFDALIKFDGPELKKYMAEADLKDFSDDDLSEDMFADDEGFDFMTDVIKNTSIKFKSGEIKPEDKETQLTYEMTRSDMSAIFKELEDQAKNAGEDTMPSIDVKKIANKSLDLTIDMVKEKDEWKVTHADDLVMKIWGVDEIMEYVFANLGEEDLGNED